uniref:G-protein coupled receptors family 1 profile domain-containing protein n=1 Tax=Romanomermis culicivorax TaxID=13658 RepID=A0A915KCS7_ROMCU
MSTFWCRMNDTASKDNHTLCVDFNDDHGASLGSWEPLFLFYSRNLHVTLSSVICVVGLLGNLLLMTVLLRPNMLSQGGHGAVHVILASIALTDLLTDFTNLIYVMGRSIHTRNDHKDQQNPCDWSTFFFYGYTWNVFVLVHADISVFLHALSLYLTVVLAYMRVRVIYSGGANVGMRSGGRNNYPLLSLSNNN